MQQQGCVALARLSRALANLGENVDKKLCRVITEAGAAHFLRMSLAAHMVLDAPLVAQNDLVGLVVSRESVVADSDGGGVKALCGSVELLRNGDIYWTAPCTLRSNFTAPKHRLPFL